MLCGLVALLPFLSVPLCVVIIPFFTGILAWLSVIMLYGFVLIFKACRPPHKGPKGLPINSMKFIISIGFSAFQNIALYRHFCHFFALAPVTKIRVVCDKYPGGL